MEVVARRPPSIRKESLIKHWNGQHLDLGLHANRNKFLLFTSSSVYDILLWQPKQTTAPSERAVLVVSSPGWETGKDEGHAQVEATFAEQETSHRVRKQMQAVFVSFFSSSSPWLLHRALLSDFSCFKKSWTKKKKDVHVRDTEESDF